MAASAAEAPLLQASNPFEADMNYIRSLEDKLNAAKELTSRRDFPALRNNSTVEVSIRYIRRIIRERMGGQAVTKAWLKMYEMLKLPQVSENILSNAIVRGFFNAELPGSFITATNHFLKTRERNLEWVISSLYPREQEGSFLQDIYGIVENNPERSLMGMLMTNKGKFWSNGDMTDPNMPPISSQLARSKLGEINLYTADGGFGVEEREALQEKLMIPLVAGEVLCGFRSLKIGGLMIVKIFTFFTPTMLTMLTLLMRSFVKFYLFKPNTSSPLNSEVYCIGVSFTGVDSTAMEKLQRTIQGENIIFVEPTLDEKRYLLDQMTLLTNKQIENIETLMSGRPLNVESLNTLFIDLTPLSPDQKIPMYEGK